MYEYACRMYVGMHYIMGDPQECGDYAPNVPARSLILNPPFIT